MKIKQATSLTKRIELHINKESLLVDRKGLSASDKINIPYYRISPDVLEIKRFEWWWIVAAGVALLGGTPALNEVLSSTPVSEEQKGLYGFMIFSCVILPVLFLTVAYQRSYNYLVFTDSKTGGSLFAIKPKSPSKIEVTAFVNELKARINSAIYPSDLTFEQKREIYKKHLDFLLNEGVLKEVEYDEVISRVFRPVANVVELVK